MYTYGDMFDSPYARGAQVDTDRLEARLHGARVLVPKGPARFELRGGHRRVEHGRWLSLRQGGSFVFLCYFWAVFASSLLLDEEELTRGFCSLFRVSRYTLPSA